ncbi:MAG: response regulator [Novosphingobium sp.]|nr:response regulator [Novosphingobium sp.]
MLLVEDDAAVRRSLQLLLSSDGYDVRAYPSAVGLANDPEALRAECLVADLIMPHKGALELLGELRAAGWGAPAILISGHLSEETRKLARTQGFDMILAKPIPDASLSKAIELLLQRPRSGASCGEALA